MMGLVRGVKGEPLVYSLYHPWQNVDVRKALGACPHANKTFAWSPEMIELEDVVRESRS